MTDQELFNAAANKTLMEIKQISDEEVQRQAIRYYFNRMLMNYDDENPLVLPELLYLNTGDEVGLSSNDQLQVRAFSMTEGEGYINIWINGSEDDPIDIDELSNECLIDLLEQYEES